MSYDFRESKKRVIDELTTKTKIGPVVNPTDNKLTYENGARSWISAIFVDIRKSTEYFKNTSDDIIARTLRAFSSELIKIMKDGAKYLQIGLRGDCVYAVYPTPNKSDIVEVFRVAYRINAFMKMLRVLLEQKNMPTIEAGIGLGVGNDLVIKAGDNGSGINDIIWIGDAVVDASNNSDRAKKEVTSEIVMSNLFYTNIIEILSEENPEYKEWISNKKSGSYYGYSQTLPYYHCSIVQSNFSDWIDKGFSE